MPANLPSPSSLRKVILVGVIICVGGLIFLFKDGGSPSLDKPENLFALICAVLGGLVTLTLVPIFLSTWQIEIQKEQEQTGIQSRQLLSPKNIGAIIAILVVCFMISPYIARAIFHVPVFRITSMEELNRINDDSSYVGCYQGLYDNFSTVTCKGTGHDRLFEFLMQLHGNE